MRGSAIALLAAVLPALAAEPPPAMQPPSGTLPPGSTCYFIHQINRNLQPPRAKPELIPLASAVAAPIANSNPDCLPYTLVRKAGDKVVKP